MIDYLIRISGRWWVVGSAWKGRELTDVMQKPVMEEKEGIMEIARQQRMNTDIRRTIFCVVMTSEVCACEAYVLPVTSFSLGLS